MIVKHGAHNKKLVQLTRWIKSQHFTWLDNEYNRLKMLGRKVQVVSFRSMRALFVNKV